MRSNFRRNLLASTLLVGAAGVAAPAWAQPADTEQQENAAQSTPDETGANVQEGAAEVDQAIVVTGSRIARRDLVSSSPLAVVQDEEFKLSGTVNVEQVLNTLPQVIPGTTGFSNNPGGGVATLNLRGLGTQRNLVLVNGRRYMFFDTSQVTDLNTIPQFLIDSVDVVTGGASAVYGSDAIAGVVNFRLRNDLQGFEAGVLSAITEEGDGHRFNANIALGSTFADGRGNVAVFAEYFKRQDIFQGGRDFSSVAFGDNAAGTALIPGGSATLPGGRFAVPATQTVAGVVFNRGAGTNFSGLGAVITAPGQTSRPYVAATDAYNYAPSNYLQVPQERFLLGGYGEYEITEGVRAFAEIAFANNRVDNELAATPVTGTTNVGLAANAAFLSAADRAALAQIDANEEAIRNAQIAAGLTPTLPGLGVIALGVNRRVNETGNRRTLDERNAFRVLAGLRGGITDALNYEAYYSYSRTRNANIQNGNVSRSAFNAGVLNGTINVFGPGALTAGDVGEISILAQNNDISILQVASGNVNGSLFNFGLGGGDVGFALGAEYRSVSSRFIPDTALSSGDVVGFNAGNPTAGGYNVKEVFGELVIPIIADRPFFHKLEVTAAGRYSDYSLDDVGGVETYSAGVTWAPIRDITLRANYQRAVRAPNVGELFGGQQQGFPPATDPCALATAATDATIRALCIATGVPASQVGAGAALQPNTQIQASFGGNPNLQEEVSDSYSFGAVIRPTFIPRLNITVDYFNIKVDNAIFPAAGGANNILNFCYNIIQDADAPICQLINRDPQTGIIGDQFIIQAGNANLASLETSGVDVQVDYSLPLTFGLMGSESKLNFFFLGTYTEKNDFVPVVGIDETVRCADRFGLNCGNPQPRYKWTSRLSWIDGPVTTSVRWRHLSSATDDDDTTDYVVEELEAYDLVDLTFAFDLTDQFSMSLGVNNIFDKKPQLIGSNQEQANTYPGTYDVLGRDFFVSANVRF